MAARAGEVVAGEAPRRVGDLGADEGEGLGDDLAAEVGGRKALARRGEGQGRGENNGSPYAGPGPAAI